jgi:hypothetical protein
MTLDLEAVGDGGLQILCTWGDVQTVPTKDGIEGLKDYDAYAQAAIEAATTRLTGLQKSLAEDLADQRCPPRASSTSRTPSSATTAT